MQRMAMAVLHGCVFGVLIALFGGPLWAAVGFGGVIYWLVALWGMVAA